MPWTRRGTGTYAGSASPITAYDGGVLASASTVTLQDAFHSVSGTTQVNSFSYAGGTDRGVFLIRPTGAFPIGTSGNIVGAPATAVVDRVMMFWYDGTNYYYISSVVGAGSVITSSIADDAVTYAKIQEMAAYSVLANATNATANPTALAASGNERELIRVADALSWQRKPYITVPDLDLTNATSNTAKIQAVIDRLEALNLGGEIRLPEIDSASGRIRIEGGLTINGNGIWITGAGMGTRINHVPNASGDVLFHFQNLSSTVIQRCGLRNIFIQSSDTSTNKVAVKMTDTTEFWSEGVNIFGYTGSNSIGYQIQGRDYGTIHKALIQADRPIVIEANPNDPNIALDHFVFDNLYVSSGAAQPLISVATGINVFCSTFSNQSWVLGNAGFKWIDTTSAANSSGLVFRNIRREQGTDAAEYAINIQHNQRLRGLYISNFQTGGNDRGFRFRKCRAVLDQVYYQGTTNEALNIDGTNERVTLRDVDFLGGSTVTTTGMVAIREELDPEDNTEPLHATVTFVPSTAANLVNEIRFRDASFNLFDDADSTKAIQFNASNVTAGQRRIISAPDSNTTIPIISQILTVAGPTAARTITLPDANFTAARTDAGNQFTGNQGVGVAPSGTLGQLLSLLLTGDHSTKIVITNSDASGVSARTQLQLVGDNGTLNASHYNTGNTTSKYGVTMGGNEELLFNLASGKTVYISTQTTSALALATALQTRTYLQGTPKALTESAATAIADVTVADNTVISGLIHYAVEANDATDYQVLRGEVPFTAANKASVVTANIGTPIENSTLSSGTLTVTPTLTTGTAKITVNLNAVSSLAQTTLVASWRVHIDGGTGNVVAV